MLCLTAKRRRPRFNANAPNPLRPQRVPANEGSGTFACGGGSPNARSKPFLPAHAGNRPSCFLGLLAPRLLLGDCQAPQRRTQGFFFGKSAGTERDDYLHSCESSQAIGGADGRSFTLVVNFEWRRVALPFTPIRSAAYRSRRSVPPAAT